MIFTNECDVSGDKLINGALVKKLSSGGDSITARALYQNACRQNAAPEVEDFSPCVPGWQLTAETLLLAKSWWGIADILNLQIYRSTVLVSLAIRRGVWWQHV